MNSPVFRTLDTVHYFDSDIDEEQSYSFLQYYYLDKYLQYMYTAPDVYSMTEFDAMANNFCLFFGKIQDSTNSYIASPIPLFTFRYVMLSDGSWSSYYAVRRKPGYIVEGYSWSNGMVYQVRQDKEKDFQIYQRVLYVDHLTKTLHGYP